MLTAEKLAIIISQAELRAHRKYSGRGMFGKQCIGFYVEQGDSLMGAASVMMLAAQGGPSELEELHEAFQSARTDSMGKGTIVYFPSIEDIDEPSGNA